MLAELRLSGGIQALSRQLERAPALTLSQAEEMLTALLTAFRGYAGGIDRLLAMLGECGGAALAAAVMDNARVDTSPGETVLARIGISRTDQDRMAPMLAMLAGGYLYARASTGALSPQEIARLLQSPQAHPPEDEPV